MKQPATNLVSAIIVSLMFMSLGFAAEERKFVDLDKENVARFIDEMVSQHDFDRASLRNVLAQAEIKASILKKISTPAERRLTWGEYRDIFITKERTNAGVTFWQENEAMLDRIALETGVPVEMLVGIIGVETYFGRITGKDRVIDALATLAFAYPPRQKFFRNELIQFLILAKEEDIDPTNPTGSYAGAMGRPQFMPSSFRAYAVDATGDGKRDIWNNWADVAGSIASYFNAHGWRPNESVAAQASLGSQWQSAIPKPKNTLKVSDTIQSLSTKGVVFSSDADSDEKAQLLTYEGHDGIEHWVGFHNFFVITKYNRSVMYALAVHQLGQAIAAAKTSRDAA